MPDFVESVKNFASAAVSRTSWEAQKQLRARGKQSEIDKLTEQRHQLLDEMAQITMNLYQQGVLTDARLSRLCASIMELDNDTQKREAQLQDIKNEAYQPNQFAPGPTTDYTPPPVSPTSPSGAPHNPMQPPFGTNPAGPQPFGSAPGMGTQTQACPKCGNPLRSNALYCRSCGTKLR